YSQLQSDLVPDTAGETITLPRGGSVVYLFPAASTSRPLQPSFLQPTFPAGATRASLSYNYIYSEHLSQLTDGRECNKRCTVHIDPRLGAAYYQFTYTDRKGHVVSRSPVSELKPTPSSRR